MPHARSTPHGDLDSPVPHSDSGGSLPDSASVEGTAEGGAAHATHATDPPASPAVSETERDGLLSVAEARAKVEAERGARDFSARRALLLQAKVGDLSTREARRRSVFRRVMQSRREAGELPSSDDEEEDSVRS